MACGPNPKANYAKNVSRPKLKNHSIRIRSWETEACASEMMVGMLLDFGCAIPHFPAEQGNCEIKRSIIAFASPVLELEYQIVVDCEKR